MPALLSSYKLPGRDDLILWQCYLDVLFSKMFFEGRSEVCKEVATSIRKDLTAIEENAVRYTAGFIVHKLRERHKNSVYSPCLQNMTIVAAEEANEDTSMNWILATNRGGLKVVSDDVHSFFKEVELKSYPLLEKSIKTSQTIASEQILMLLGEDPDIQNFWEMLAMDISDKDGDKLLLKEWVAMRGHSMGKRMMEDYKVATKASTKKRSLRKELKKSHAGDDGEESKS